MQEEEEVSSGIYGLLYGCTCFFFNNVALERSSCSSLVATDPYLMDEFSSDWSEDEAENKSQEIQTCRIPQVDPWDDSIRAYVQRPKPYSCPTPAPLTKLVFSSPSSSLLSTQASSITTTASTVKNSSSLSLTNHSYSIDPPSPPIIQIVSSLESKYGNSKDGVLKCCASVVTRGKVKSEKDTNADNSYRIEKCKPFSSTYQVKSDFTLVECIRGKKAVYTDMHSFVIQNKTTFDKIAEAQYPFPPSILLLGVDSSSRLNIHRAAPKLMKALKEVGAVEMTAYNKVGDNTLPNLLPILTGISLPDANKKENLTRITNGYGCWPNNKYTFDKCPFIWRNFSQKGYVTMFGEDEPNISMFNFNKPGFREQPTDHYLRPFYVVAEKRLKKTKRASATWCYANRATLTRILEYARSFVNTYMGRAPLFSLVYITGLGHQNAADIELGDAELAEFVKHVVQVSDGMLNRGGGGLFLSVFSDHGMRWGKMRQSPFGWMEERLPFLFIRPPLIPTSPKQSPKQVIKSLYPNLLVNSKRLISPFDFHFTLYALLNGKGTHPLVSSCEKCHDLLHDFVPLDRTCADAAIPDKWCACEGDENDLVDDKTAELASIAAIDHLNKILEGDPQCSHLILKSTLSAHYRMLPTVKKNKFLKFVVVTFSADPSEAIFEATAIVKEKGYQVTSDISRLNQYGNQSWCVDDTEKKLYCYCH